MIERILRAPLQQYLVDPIARHICQWKISANYVTLVALILGMLVYPCFVNGYTSLAIFVLWLSGYMDILDGSVARLQFSSTPFGAICDIISDRIVEFSTVLALFSVDPIHRGQLCLFILGGILICVTAFLVVGIFSAKQPNKSFYYSPGLIERAEAFVFFSLMMLWPQKFYLIGYVFCSLLLWTAGNHVLQFWQYQRSFLK